LYRNARIQFDAENRHFGLSASSDGRRRKPNEETTATMPKIISGHLPFVLTPKTCSRCGRSFGAAGREYTCPSCRKPVPKERSVAVPRLSFREGQIVQLIQAAKSNKEIAYDLCLTVGTVKEYLFHIFRKLDVKNRTELALWGTNRPARGGYSPAERGCTDFQIIRSAS
jgi:DNA-binding CsgD family transcriptional regulator